MYQLKRLVSQGPSPAYTAVPTDNTTSPLLAPQDDEPAFPDRPNYRPRPRWRRVATLSLITVVLLGCMAAVAVFTAGPRKSDKSVPSSPQYVPPASTPETEYVPEKSPTTDEDISDPVTAARVSLEALVSRQSRTLKQAAARYTLKAGRAPPRNYDKWFTFAREHKCLIDEYDLIIRDFEPWAQVARKHPKHFKEMIARGRELMRKDSAGMDTIGIKNGTVVMPSYTGTSFDGDWPRTVGRFAHFLPDMEFLLNGRDEPRVVFDVRKPGALESAIQLKDTNPFHVSPRPTSDFFKDKSGCSPLSADKGFGMDGSADIAFLRSSSSSDFTTDLWPLLSMTKISPCFSDILYPGQYFYDDSWWSGSFAFSNNVKWEDKLDKIYWRGMSNGGHIIGDNYRRFPRFRLIDMARNNSDILDVRMTQFAETHCTTNCDRSGIIAEYNIGPPADPKENIYKYKYLLDVDGNTFSGRFLGLLKSGSLVFKSTAFDEYFNHWLRPYEHYIPVRPDLSDLMEKVRWAMNNQNEARRIQESGKLFTETVISDAQNDCYFALVLLEWARLEKIADEP
ncbi:unnamed protein product [Mycena citricolor]|uniref:Glycosyl transferase CAP10 domain-containing protein n=1 Tax=Mycena citricolor TaxID=2018698 RepID=A0AAD2Q7B3_9AGAR|nr:unnamed protein product [Mycena citricolor]